MNLKKKTVYIPIEIKAREFLSQLLLATKIAEKGGRVYVGSKAGIWRALFTKRKRAGTLLYKGGMGGENQFEELKKRVEAIAVLDQEVSPRSNVFDPAARFLGDELDFVDRLYYVGQDAADSLFASRPELPKYKVKVFGWPRVDLWGQRYANLWAREAETIRERFGEFVLFSSDFGVLHTEDIEWRLEQAQIEQAQNRPETHTSQTDLSNVRRELESSLREFHEVIGLLTSFDNEPTFPPIVVRPHPSESFSRWIAAVKGLRKTYVVFEGDITPWLHASVALLHRGCTTALQAEVCGKATGLLKTKQSRGLEQATRIPVFSKSIATVQDGLALVDPGYEVPKATISSLRVASLDGTASEKIATDLIALTVQPEGEIPAFWRAAFRRNVVTWLIHRTWSRFLRWFQPAGFSIPKDVAVNKMPGGVRVAEVRDVLERLGMGHLTLRQTGKDLVCIEKLCL